MRFYPCALKNALCSSYLFDQQCDFWEIVVVLEYHPLYLTPCNQCFEDIPTFLLYWFGMPIDKGAVTPVSASEVDLYDMIKWHLV